MVFYSQSVLIKKSFFSNFMMLRYQKVTSATLQPLSLEKLGNVKFDGGNLVF